MNIIEHHHIMQCNLIHRTVNRGTRDRSESVSRATTHGGLAWITPHPSHCR
jgi:hypothetical protein